MLVHTFRQHVDKSFLNHNLKHNNPISNGSKPLQEEEVPASADNCDLWLDGDGQDPIKLLPIQ